MSSEEYDEKRGPNLGARTVRRHAVQGATTSVGLMGILQACVELQWLDQAQAFLALGLIPPVLTSVWKGWDGLRMKDRVNAVLDKRMPLSMLLIVFLCSGCALQLGTMEPRHFTSLDGTMLIACETKGILLTMGDADICSNAMRGGRVSKTFSDMTLGVFRTAGAIVAGFFGGAGQGVAAAVRADEARAVEAPADEAEAQRATELEKMRESDGDANSFFSTDTTTLENPFTAPDPD